MAGPRPGAAGWRDGPITARARQHGPSAPARLQCLLRARLSALGSSALPARAATASSARVLELAASHATDITAFEPFRHELERLGEARAASVALETPDG